MSGHAQYAIVGVVAVLCGLWLLWGPLQALLQKGRTKGV
jgi:hypothetical protein